MIRRGLVLAAGLGTRLRGISGGRPKFLVGLEGRPLVYYPLAVLHSVGASEACIVVPPGWEVEAKKIAESIYGSGAVGVVVNPRVELGNGVSLLIGLECIGWDSVVVSMTDHLYTGPVAERVAEALWRDSYGIGVDHEPLFIDVLEATKVETIGDRVVRVGKNVSRFTGVDVGVHSVRGDFLHGETRTSSVFADIQLSELAEWLARQGRCKVVDVTGLPWTEIDTPRDYWEVVRGKRRQVLDAVKKWLRE